jgi:hypothetical protein
MRADSVLGGISRRQKFSRTTFDRTHVMLDALADILTRIGGYLALALIAGLLFLLGNLVFGWRQEGGRRLVLFVIGAGAVYLADEARLYFWPAFVAQDYPKALGLLVPLCFFPFGGTLLGIALAAHNDWVRLAFSVILRGL